MKREMREFIRESITPTLVLIALFFSVNCSKKDEDRTGLLLTLDKVSCERKIGFKWNSTQGGCSPQAVSLNLENLETQAFALKMAIRGDSNEDSSDIKPNRSLRRKVNNLKDLLTALSHAKEEERTPQNKAEVKDVLKKLQDEFSFETSAIFLATLKPEVDENLQKSIATALGRAQLGVQDVAQTWEIEGYKIRLGNGSGQHDLNAAVLALRTAFNNANSPTATADQIVTLRKRLLAVNPVYYKTIPMNNLAQNSKNIAQVKLLITELNKIIPELAPAKGNNPGGNITQSIATLKNAALSKNASQTDKDNFAKARTSAFLLPYYPKMIMGKYFIGKLNQGIGIPKLIATLKGKRGSIRRLVNASKGGFDLSNPLKSSILIEYVMIDLEKLRPQIEFDGKVKNVLFPLEQTEVAQAKPSLIPMLELVDYHLSQGDNAISRLVTDASDTEPEKSNSKLALARLTQTIFAVKVAYGISKPKQNPNVDSDNQESLIVENNSFIKDTPQKTLYIVDSQIVDYVYNLIETGSPLETLLQDKNTLAKYSANAEQLTYENAQTALKDALIKLRALKIASKPGNSSEVSMGNAGYDPFAQLFDLNHPQNAPFQAKIKAVLDAFKTKATATHSFSIEMSDDLHSASQNPSFDEFKENLNAIFAEIREIAPLWKLTGYTDANGELPQIVATAKEEPLHAYHVEDEKVTNVEFFLEATQAIGKILIDGNTLELNPQNSQAVSYINAEIALWETQKELEELKKASTGGTSSEVSAGNAGYDLSVKFFDPTDRENTPLRTRIESILEAFKTKALATHSFEDEMNTDLDENSSQPSFDNFKNALNAVFAELREIAELWNLPYTSNELPDITIDAPQVTRTAYHVAEGKVSDVTSLLSTGTTLEEVLQEENTLEVSPLGAQISYANAKQALDDILTKLQELKKASTGGTSSEVSAGNAGYDKTTHTFNHNDTTNAPLKERIKIVLNAFKNKVKTTNHSFKKEMYLDLDSSTNPTFSDFKNTLNSVLIELRKIAQLWNLTGYTDTKGEIPNIP